MTEGTSRPFDSSETVVAGLVLLAVTTAAWVTMLRDASSMVMPMGAASVSLADGAAFTVRWGVMMVAMMLPSAAPMIMLYRTVSRRLAADGDRVIPYLAFASIYLLLWMLIGVPVYLASVAVSAISSHRPSVDSAIPYAIGAVLIAAGAYQLTGVKRACLRHCESPLGYLMKRFKSGYLATAKLAAEHAGYCIGCCWGLMAILVAAGAMSMAWVAAITVLVFAERVLPHGWRVAQVAGVALIALGVAVLIKPELAFRLKPQMPPMSMAMNRWVER